MGYFTKSVEIVEIAGGNKKLGRRMKRTVSNDYSVGLSYNTATSVLDGKIDLANVKLNGKTADEVEKAVSVLFSSLGVNVEEIDKARKTEE